MKKLKWKYCECGCHGHELRIAGSYFWSFMELSSPPVCYLSAEHDGQVLGEFKSREAMNKVVLGLLHARIPKLEKKLRKLKELFDE